MPSFKEEVKQLRATEGTEAPSVPITSISQGGSFRQEVQKLRGNKDLMKDLNENTNEGGFLKEIFREPIRLGEFIGTVGLEDDVVREQEQLANFYDIMRRKVIRGELDTEQKQRLQKIMGIKTELPPAFDRSSQQIAGDVAGTLLWVTPIQELKLLKGLTPMARLSRGAAFGSAFATARGLSEDADPEELFKHAATGAVFGSGIEFGLPLATKGIGKLLIGAGKAAFLPPKLVGKGVAKITPEVIKKPLREVAGDFKRFFLPVQERLNTMGTHGEEIAERFAVSRERTLIRAGTAMEEMEEAGLRELTEQEAIAIADVLEGFEKPEVLTQKARNVFKVMDRLRKEIEQEAKEKGIKIKLKRGEKVPFVPRKNFYPHEIPDIKLIRERRFGNKIRERILNFAVQRGRFNTREEAIAVLDGYINFVETNGRGDASKYWIEYMVRSGQAKNRTEAVGMTTRFFSPGRLSRSGHLERARELDFPFYDPDVRYVFPKYYFDSVQRLERVAEYGVDAEKLNLMVGRLKRELKRTRTAKEAEKLAKELNDKEGALLRKMFGTYKKTGDVSLFLRMLQIPKLAFAQILNLGQSLNTLLATDLQSLGYGLERAFRQEGVNNALKAGATLETVLRESAQLGDETRFGNLFLKYSGFTWTEKFNRTVAANAGMQYARRLRRKLLQNPTDETTKRLLAELGLDAGQLLKRDFTEKELLAVAQKMSFLTQFRSAGFDMPAFAASPEGKVIFQFKNFIFNQTRFVKNQLQKEIQANNPERVTRAVFILSMIYPMTGEVIADVRSLISGTQRPTKFLDRYLNNLINTGAIGIWGDMMQSLAFDDLADFVAGPTAGTVFETMERLYDIGTTGKIRDSDIKFLLQQPGITRPLGNYMFAKDSKEWQTILKQLE